MRSGAAAARLAARQLTHGCGRLCTLQQAAGLVVQLVVLFEVGAAAALQRRSQVLRYAACTPRGAGRWVVTSEGGGEAVPPLALLTSQTPHWCRESPLPFSSTQRPRSFAPTHPWTAGAPPPALR